MKTFLHQFGHELKHARWLLLGFIGWELLWALAWSNGAAWNAPSTPTVVAAYWIEILHDFISIVLIIATVPTIFLHDSPWPPTAFLTTKPVSKSAHLLAKLAVVTIFFCLVPALLVAASHYFGGVTYEHSKTEFLDLLAGYFEWAIICAGASVVGGNWRNYSIVCGFLVFVYLSPVFLPIAERMIHWKFDRNEYAAPALFYLFTPERRFMFFLAGFSVLGAIAGLVTRRQRVGMVISLGLASVQLWLPYFRDAKWALGFPSYAGQPPITLTLPEVKIDAQKLPLALVNSTVRLISDEQQTCPVSIGTNDLRLDWSYGLRDRDFFIAPETKNDPHDLSFVLRQNFPSHNQEFRRVVTDKKSFSVVSINLKQLMNYHVLIEKPEVTSALPLKVDSKIMVGMDRLVISNYDTEETETKNSVVCEILCSPSVLSGYSLQASTDLMWLLVNPAKGYWVKLQRNGSPDFERFALNTQIPLHLTASWSKVDTGSIADQKFYLVRIVLIPQSKSNLELRTLSPEEATQLGK